MSLMDLIVPFLSSPSQLGVLTLSTLALSAEGDQHLEIAPNEELAAHDCE